MNTQPRKGDCARGRERSRSRTTTMVMNLKLVQANRAETIIAVKEFCGTPQLPLLAEEVKNGYLGIICFSEMLPRENMTTNNGDLLFFPKVMPIHPAGQALAKDIN